jgi:lipoic acid synthetase
MRIQSNNQQPITNNQQQKPPWLKIRPPTTDKFATIKQLLKAKKLNTVCTEANCPNASKCWSSGTATFMILGDTCTRACRFCNVKSGNPNKKIDLNEPQHLSGAVKIMKLTHVVITCVTRDDLLDGGAEHWYNCISKLKKDHPNLTIEILISDLNGDIKALEKIIDAKPDVIGHNLETVKRLQAEVRDPRANYEKSLKMLAAVKQIDPKIYTKTSLMLGLGETEKEVEKTMKDARKAGTDFLTLGQYLQPGPYHLPVKKYIPPEQFKHYKTLAKKHGFVYCASAPFVRSSYKAGEYFKEKNVYR